MIELEKIKKRISKLHKDDPEDDFDAGYNNALEDAKRLIASEINKTVVENED